MAIIAYAIVKATIVKPQEPGRGTLRSETQHEIANRRYESGEITKDEFEEVKKTIK